MYKFVVYFLLLAFIFQLATSSAIQASVSRSKVVSRKKIVAILCFIYVQNFCIENEQFFLLCFDFKMKFFGAFFFCLFVC